MPVSYVKTIIKHTAHTFIYSLTHRQEHLMKSYAVRKSVWSNHKHKRFVATDKLLPWTNNVKRKIQPKKRRGNSKFCWFFPSFFFVSPQLIYAHEPMNGYICLSHIWQNHKYKHTNHIHMNARELAFTRTQIIKKCAGN